MGSQEKTQKKIYAGGEIVCDGIMDAKLEGKLSQYSDLSWLNNKRYLCQFSQIEFVMIQIMQRGQQTRMKKK